MRSALQYCCLLFLIFIFIYDINFKFYLLITVLGKVHGSLARAGKVRGQTPKVDKQEKKKKKVMIMAVYIFCSRCFISYALFL